VKRASGAQGSRSQVVTPVESVLHFGEIAVSVLGELDCVAGTRHRRLQVTQHHVDGLVVFNLNAGPPATCDRAIVDHTQLLSDREAVQAVGHHGDGQRNRREH
jgi:hypothetical protein